LPNLSGMGEALAILAAVLVALGTVYSLHDIGTLLVGIAFGTLVTVLHVRHRHRGTSREAPSGDSRSAG
jgi:hypothetical protein